MILAFFSFCNLDGMIRHLSRQGKGKEWFSSKYSNARLLAWLTLMAIVFTPVSFSTVNRINLGVLFEKQGEVDAVYDFWSHTFQIVLPQVPPPRLRIFLCNETQEPMRSNMVYLYCKV